MKYNSHICELGFFFLEGDKGFGTSVPFLTRNIFVELLHKVMHYWI